MPARSDTRDLTELEKILGHHFKKDILLRAALTHPSLNNAARKKAVPLKDPSKTLSSSASNYERLEFLGDRVLGLVIAEWLYLFFPNSDEGDLAKRHAALVNRDCLREVAIEIRLEKYLRLARGEDPLAIRKNLATLADATEAIIGALYLDGGLDCARQFITRHWENLIHKGSSPPVDTKTALQEYAQSKGYDLPAYRVLSCTGPSHAPKFQVEVCVQNVGCTQAEGTSKRLAEKAAAELLLASLTTP